MEYVGVDIRRVEAVGVEEGGGEFGVVKCAQDLQSEYAFWRRLVWKSRNSYNLNTPNIFNGATRQMYVD